MKELENRLVHYEAGPLPFRDEFEVETINVESVRVFRQYGGIDVSKLKIKMRFWDCILNAS